MTARRMRSKDWEAKTAARLFVPPLYPTSPPPPPPPPSTGGDGVPPPSGAPPPPGVPPSTGGADPLLSVEPPPVVTPPVTPERKVQHVLPPALVLSVALMAGSLEQASESLTLTKETMRVPRTLSSQATPADEERSHARVPAAMPFQSMFWKVEVAPAKNCAEVEGSMVKVLDAETALEKMTDCVASPVPIVFRISRLLKAQGLVRFPATVCWVVPERYTLPELCVNPTLLV